MRENMPMPGGRFVFAPSSSAGGTFEIVTVNVVLLLPPSSSMTKMRTVWLLGPSP